MRLKKLFDPNNSAAAKKLDFKNVSATNKFGAEMSAPKLLRKNDRDTGVSMDIQFCRRLSIVDVIIRFARKETETRQQKVTNLQF